ncbi:sensor histidine kinase [Halobellus limi]|uniref:histidine kinase n=1 Tax=Halobellus limi TaxID=699433 RepID=A0A1H5VYK6_9EURY|nr:HAMP domain-containing sensor histidine kinase [Halobellus limi]QCC46589.1 sensor histidine kinase [Halobellus limi]SEF91961.1 Signal transduction histidine kinase [Halobellus limi]
MRTRIVSLLDQIGFGSPPESITPTNPSALRVAASAVVSLTGLALLVPNLFPVFDGGGAFSIALGLVGALVSLGLVAVGGLLYYSGFSDRNAVRIAVWNVLGVAVLGSVMLAHAIAQNRLSGGIAPSMFTVGNLLAVGAAAHVIIGVYDARRVRAEQLARERRRTAVLNRVLRHNLRNEAQVLAGHADIVAGVPDAERIRQSAAVLKRSAETVGSLAEGAKTITRERDRAAEEYGPTDPAAVLEAAVEHARDRFPGRSFEFDAPDDLDATVRASDGLRTALDELLENAAEHGEPPIEASVRVLPDTVELAITDHGDGIPDHERDVVAGETDITQLTHGSGLGLWVAKTVAGTHWGSLSFSATDDSTTVTLSVPRA